jgi:hypothetical protein
MVRDNITGLIWENKTDDGTINDRDIKYNWTDAQTVFITTLNNNNFGNNSDWRLPTVQELAYIVDRGAHDPSINTTYFQQTVTDYYWTSTIYTPDSTRAWNVYFGSGFVLGEPKTTLRYVRAVRGAQSTQNFTDNSNGTITDNNTNLMWQQSGATNNKNWQNALKYCEDLVLAGFDDWRLPNIKELMSVADYNKANPCIDTTYFTNTANDRYWASTTYSNAFTDGLYVNFGPGGFTNLSKTNSYYVRCVRVVQPTIIELIVFVTKPESEKVIIKWETASEIDNAGFNIYRAETENGDYIQINEFLIVAQGTTTEGAAYEYVDAGVKNRTTYYYKLEDIDLNGNATFHGPVSATPLLIYGIGK